MTKLCEVCKQVEVDSADLICTVCIQEKKEKLQKKRKKEMLIGLVSSLILIIIGLLLFWGSQVYSKEKTEEKFFLALENQDKQLLKSIVYHNDFTSVQEFEVEALINLVQKHGLESIKTYFTLDTNSKVFGIFDKYDVLMTNQFIQTEKTDEIVEYTFNGQSIEGTRQPNGQIIYGPLLPGIYTIQGTINSLFGNFVKTEEKAFITYDEKIQTTGLFFKTGYTQFIIEDYNQYQLDSVSIEMNGQILIMEDGKTPLVGPIVLDAQSKYKVIVETPWGTIESEEKLVEPEVNYVQLQVVNDEIVEKITNVIETYGHQRAKSIANLDSSHFTIATENYKKSFENMFHRIDGYKGQLIYAGVDRNAIYLKNLDKNTTEVTVLALLKYKEAFYLIGQETELYEEVYPFNIKLLYDHTTGKFLVDQAMNLYNVAVNITDEATVEPVLFEPNEQLIQQALNEEFKQIIEDLVADGAYFASLVLTNNNKYFLERVLTSEGVIHQQLENILLEVNKKQQQYYFEQSEMLDYKLVDLDKWLVETKITYKTYTNEEEDIKSFITQSYVMFENNKFLFDEIISYEEVK